MQAAAKWLRTGKHREFCLATIVLPLPVVVAVVNTGASALARLFDARRQKREQFVQRLEMEITPRVDLSIHPTNRCCAGWRLSSQLTLSLGLRYDLVRNAFA
jgi:hypothetical protein